VVMPMLAYGLTGSVAVTALVVAVEGLPYLFLGSVAADLAHRVARRRLMVGANLANAALLAGTSVAYGVDTLPLPLLLGAAIGVQAVFVFFAAADSGDATQSETVGVARSVVLVVAALGGIAAAPVPPALVLAVVLFVGALAFAVSGALIWSVVGPTHIGPSGAAAGQRDVQHRRFIRISVLVASALGFAAGALVAQIALSMHWVLGWSLGEPAIGVVFVMWGVGGLAAVSAFSGAMRRLGAVRLSGVLMPVSALVMVGWAFAGHPLIATAAAAGWSVVGLILVLNSITLRRQVTPEALRRRAAMGSRRLSLGSAGHWGH